MEYRKLSEKIEGKDLCNEVLHYSEEEPEIEVVYYSEEDSDSEEDLDNQRLFDKMFPSQH
jgi:hypothetical protein